MNHYNFHRSKLEPVDRSSGHCHFHPNEILVGVCPLCLNERLFTLASLKQSHYNKQRSHQYFTNITTKGHSFRLTTKFLGLDSILNRLELLNHKTSNSFYDDQDYDSSSSTSSQEDSFISIKFEENGVAFWEKGNKIDYNETPKRISKDSRQQHCKIIDLNLELVESNVSKCSNTYKNINTSVLPERSKPTHMWKKRIVHVLDQIRWKTASNTNLVH